MTPLTRGLIAVVFGAPTLLAVQLLPAERFQKVQKWIGTVSVTMTGSGSDSRSGGRAEWSVSQSGSMSLDLDRTSASRDSIHWEGQQTGNARIENSFVLTLPNHSQMGVRAAGSQQVSSKNARLSMDLERGTYSIEFDKAIDVDVMQFSGQQKSTSRQTAHWFGIPIPPRGMNPADPAALEAIAVPGYGELPLPSSGMSLAGSKTLANGALPSTLAPYNFGLFPMTVAWNLAPEGQATELIIEIDDYEAWMPEPGRNEDAAGNQVTVRATLQKRGGGDPPIKARQFEFELIDVSNLPGVAMNFPAASAAKTSPDLRFEGAGDAPTKTVTGDGAHASAVITAHDGGATAMLKVTAIPEDGGPAVEGYLKGNPALTRVPLPKRRERTRVADAWRASDLGTNSDDFADDDGSPVGDGHTGDGFTVFEEYRGFIGEGRFQRLNAKRKELFVHDTVGGMARAGLQLYERQSEVIVHRLNRTELPFDRTVNFNSPRPVEPQRGVRIAADSAQGFAFAGGDPGPPAGGDAVHLPPTFARRQGPSVAIFDSEGGTTGYANFIATIAHELLHRSSVWHHGGEIDDSVNWHITVLEGGRLRVLEDGSEVTLLREDGSPALATALVPATPGAETTIDLAGVTIGVDHGEHSGDEHCLMRYDTSHAYRSATDAKVRYFVAERTGMSMCRSAAGTGVNDRNHRPQSRYGDADLDARRGNCVEQICVKDTAPRIPH